MTAVVMLNRYAVPPLCAGVFLICLVWLCVDTHELFQHDTLTTSDPSETSVPDGWRADNDYVQNIPRLP